MISREEAEQLAIQHLGNSPPPVEILRDRVVTMPYGWVFFYQSVEYLETGDKEAALLGNLPLLVEAASGTVHVCPMPLEEALERFESTGSTARTETMLASDEMRKNMTQDYYAEAKHVAELVAREGEQALADQIIEVLEGGSTATEILMGLRFRLQQALAAGRTGGETTTAQIRSLMRSLNRALA